MSATLGSFNSHQCLRYIVFAQRKRVVLLNFTCSCFVHIVNMFMVYISLLFLGWKLSNVSRQSIFTSSLCSVSCSTEVPLLCRQTCISPLVDEIHCNGQQNYIPLLLVHQHGNVIYFRITDNGSCAELLLDTLGDEIVNTVDKKQRLVYFKSYVLNSFQKRQSRKYAILNEKYTISVVKNWSQTL